MGFRIVFLIVLTNMLCFMAYSQTTVVKAERYINKYQDIAISNMKNFGIPASITMAQGLLESGYGESQLASKSNNHFGIKCKSNWKGKKVYHDDDEANECFRKYDSVADSYADHGVFLTSSPRYAHLFNLDITDYKGWAKGLKKAGYATNPKYAELLISMIERYELHNLDSRAGRKSRVKQIRVAENRVDIATNLDQIVNDEVAGAYVLNGRKVYRKGKSLFTYALPGDTFERIANTLRISERKLERYNKDIKRIAYKDVIYLNNKHK